MVAVVVVVGCTRGKHEATTTIRASDVVSVRLHPYPEGPQSPGVTPSDPTWPQVRDALPDPLPKPLNQPTCSGGRVTTLELKNKTIVAYGPCRVPDSIARVACAMLGTDPCVTGAD
jgi:hypothetical protein